MEYGAAGEGLAVPGGQQRALVAGDSRRAVEAAKAAVAMGGGRLLDTVGLRDLGDRLKLQVNLDILMLEMAECDTDTVDAAVETLIATPRQPRGADIAAVVSIDFAQIDRVAGRLHGPGFHILCEPTIADRVTALVMAGAERGLTALSDLSREDEQERLRRLDEDVARIADALTRLTGRNPTSRPTGIAEYAPAKGQTLHEQPLSFHARSSETAARPATGDDIAAAAHIRNIIKARRLRDQFFEGSLFADPAWDMLLDLYAARLEHRRVSVSSLCIAAAVPPTTALRWISTMSEAGLLVRIADPLDKRRAFIALSEQAEEGMRGYSAMVERAGLPFC